MTLRFKIYLTASAIIIGALLAFSLWSNYQVRKLENRVNDAKSVAADHQRHSDELEQRSRAYKEKIVYLESQLSELRSLAAKQDEELTNIETNTGNARRDVERTRSVQSAAATAAEVCRKLAELGHPCQ